MRPFHGLPHRWLKPDTSFMDAGARPPPPLPDELLQQWPHEGDPDLLKFPIPMPSDEHIPAMQAEAARLKHDSDLSDTPLCERWVQRVVQWFHDLGNEAGVDHPSIHHRFRQCLHRWEILCKHLCHHVWQRNYYPGLQIIRSGFKIPWAPARGGSDCVASRLRV